MVHPEAGFAAKPVHMEQLSDYGDAARYPGTRGVTFAYWAVALLRSPACFDLRLAADSTRPSSE